MSNIGLILPWIGLFLYLSLFFCLKILLQRKENALLHLWITFIFTMFFPVPLLLVGEVQSEIATIACLFGLLFLLLLIMTMAFQTGHLSYSMKQRDQNVQLWEDRDSWMMQGMMGDGFEPFAGVVMKLWLLLMSCAFFDCGETTMGVLIGIAGLFIIRDFIILINHTRVHSKKLKWFQMNPLITNFHSLISFAILIIWLTFN